MRKNLLTIVLLAAGLLCSTFSWAVSDTCVAKIGETEYTSFMAAFNYAKDYGGTIVMYADATDMSGQCYISTADITIDLNGKTIFGSGYFYPDGKSLTIVDNSAEKTGKFSSTFSSYLIRNKGTLTIEGGTFVSSGSSGIVTQSGTATLNNGHFACVVNRTGGTLNINGGLFTQMPTGTYTVATGKSIEATSETIGGIKYNFKVVAATPTARIGSTEYTSLDAAYNAAQENDVIELLKDASTTLALSKNVKYTGDFTLTCTGIISAGVFDCAVTSGTGLLRGGSFKNQPVATDVYTTMYTVDYDGNYYNVVLDMDKMVASIGTTYYASLQDAFTAMLNNETVTLLKDVEGEYVWQPNNSNELTLTLDLNGNKIVSTTGTALRIYQQTSISGTYNYTIKDTQGTGLIKGVDKVIYVDHNSQKKIYLTIKEGVNVEAADTSRYAIYSASYQTSSYKHTITIEGGNFVGKLNKDIKEGYYYSLYVLQGGTYTYQADTSEIARASNYATLPWPVSTYQDAKARGFVLLDGYNYYPGDKSGTWEVLKKPCNITVGESQHGTIAVTWKSGKPVPSSVETGKTVYFINIPEDGYRLANYVVNGAAVSPSEGISTEYMVNEDITVSGNFEEIVYICQNTKTAKKYDLLSEAVSEAGEGDSIHILKDFTISKEEIQSDMMGNIWIEIKSGNHIVIDLKGYTISVPETAAGYQEAYLQISGYLTLQNGSIEGLNSYLIQTNKITESDKSDLILKELSINRGIGMYNLSKLTLDNVNINASNGNGIWMDGGYSHSSELIVNSGVYRTAGTTPAILVSNLRSHKVSINGGSFNNSTKVDGDNVTYAKLSICGGKFAVAPAEMYLASGYSVTETFDATLKDKYPYEVARVYSRENLTAGRIGTICLPYDVEAGDFKGANFYEIAYKEDGKVYFDQVDALQAGYAYVFEPSATKIECKQTGDAVDTEVPANGLHGTFSGITADQSTLVDNYLVSNNIIQKCAQGSWLSANRAYIVMSEVPGDSTPQAPGRKRIVLGNTQANTPTELENVNVNANANGKFILNGQFIIVKDGKRFNAQGARL